MNDLVVSRVDIGITQGREGRQKGNRELVGELHLEEGRRTKN